MYNKSWPTIPPSLPCPERGPSTERRNSLSYEKNPLNRAHIGNISVFGNSERARVQLWIWSLHPAAHERHAAAAANAAGNAAATIAKPTATADDAAVNRSDAVSAAIQ
jgi:hypothetical protein